MTINTNGDTATVVDVDLVLRGPVTSVNQAAGSLVVDVQTVLVTTSTRIDLGANEDSEATTGHTLADVVAFLSANPGAVAEVTGTRNADNTVTATNLELKTATEIDEDGEANQNFEVEGPVKDLDTVAQTFTVGGLIVDYSATTLPEGVSNGTEVKAEGMLKAGDPQVMVASSVRLADNVDTVDLPPLGSSVTLEDEVKKLDLVAKTFALDGFTIDFAAASVTGSLVGEVQVTVIGTVDASDARLVHAATVAVGIGTGN